MHRVSAIYTRQSVDRLDSISVESQVEFCKREVGCSEYAIYTDKGYSGKNTLSGYLLDVSIGQYDTYTPIEISQYITTIANNGKRMQQYLSKTMIPKI